MTTENKTEGKAARIFSIIRRLIQRPAVPVVALVIACMSSVATIFLYLKLSDVNAQLGQVKWDQFLQEMRVTKGMVDLTVPTMQEIGNGFLAAKLQVEQHLTGVKVRGLMINATALGHQNAKFKITIAGKEKEFSVNRVMIGGSTGFDVYVPDVPLNATNSARLEYVESLVQYNR